MEKEIGDYGGVILEYRIALGNSLGPQGACFELTESVNRYIQEGYKTVGSIQVVCNRGSYSIFQVMIKED